MNRSIDDAGKMRYDQLLRLLYERYGIVHAAVCECGAVTFEVEQGIGYSMRKENIHQFFLDLPEDFSSLVERFGGTYFMCNHCVNHWGLDLCACASGEPPETCDNGFPECVNPGQRIWEKRRICHGAS